MRAYIISSSHPISPPKSDDQSPERVPKDITCTMINAAATSIPDRTNLSMDLLMTPPAINAPPEIIPPRLIKVVDILYASFVASTSSKSGHIITIWPTQIKKRQPKPLQRLTFLKMLRILYFLPMIHFSLFSLYNYSSCISIKK